MSLKLTVSAELPYLRRYARALTGSQHSGDAAVHHMLAAIAETPANFDSDSLTRVDIYRIFHVEGQSGLRKSTGQAPIGDSVIGALPFPSREALLLTAVEGFSEEEAAEILGCSCAEIASQVASARQSITESLKSKVLIIEDEAIIAMHIRSIVEQLGHSVTAVARTRTEAVALTEQTQPQLVLADISLADGSSGIDAVNDILSAINVPVMFITAFPDRLLTGERPEPTYLITKPFEPETVIATIGQALLVHREKMAATEPAKRVLDDATPDPRRHFDTPGALLADPLLSDDQKHDLLTEWGSEIDGRLQAESEGMSASHPISAAREARLAVEAGKVNDALKEVPTKLP